MAEAPFARRNKAKPRSVRVSLGTYVVPSEHERRDIALLMVRPKLLTSSATGERTYPTCVPGVTARAPHGGESLVWRTCGVPDQRALSELIRVRREAALVRMRVPHPVLVQKTRMAFGRILVSTRAARQLGTRALFDAGTPRELHHIQEFHQ